MGRYLKLWWSFISNCITREMGFRLNFFLRTLTGSVWFFMSVLTFWVVFEHTKEIAGWTKYEIFFLVGTSHVTLRLFMTFFFENLMRLPDLIRNGELDFYLVKPVQAQFILSTRYFSTDAVADLTIGAGMMLYAGFHLDMALRLSNVPLYLLLVLNGIAIYYSIMFLMVTTSFWFLRFNAGDIWWQLTNMARQPGELFPGKVQMLLTYCLPMLVITNFPVKALLGRLSPAQAAIGLLMSGAMLLLSSLFFNLAIKRYRSASS